MSSVETFPVELGEYGQPPSAEIDESTVEMPRFCGAGVSLNCKHTKNELWLVGNLTLTQWSTEAIAVP